MEERVESIHADEARDLSRLAELKASLPERWNVIMKDIRDAANKGFWSLAVVTEMDIITQLENAGYRVKHINGVSWHTATRALIMWN